MGFPDAFEARLCYYRRAKLLFDFDTTSDGMSIAQGAVLLTYYSSDREPVSSFPQLSLSITDVAGCEYLMAQSRNSIRSTGASTPLLTDLKYVSIGSSSSQTPLVVLYPP